MSNGDKLYGKEYLGMRKGGGITTLDGKPH